jgi:hypothetical protein
MLTLSRPLVRTLIAHFDSVFAGPNGDHPAVLDALAGVTAAQALWKPAHEACHAGQIDYLKGSINEVSAKRLIIEKV